MDRSNSRKSDAAATRKRRSSILKSQRQTRTPFSELEFNVATPPDAAKSRRVSFSRRTGVAEFEITEATTAWKNVYEEHNKSLEASVNVSDDKGHKKPGRRVAHLGSRAADFQFEDVEAEIISLGPRDQFIPSFSNDNQDTGDDKSLSAPHRNFELSEFTNQQTNNLFDDDDAGLVMPEMTDRIDLNFSAVAPLADDNFELMPEDLEQDKKGNMSYIDVDFNATHFSIPVEGSGLSDMSITDTIHSPQVAAAKSEVEERKSSVNDWVADKENIAVNPYVAPLPTENFVVNDDCDDVLVFDGKKCKFQSNLSSKSLANPTASGPNGPNSKGSNKIKTIVYNDDADDISVTQAVAAQIILPKQDLDLNNRQTSDTLYDDDLNISITQAVPSNVIISNQPEAKLENQNTILFDNLAGISVTQALPSNILGQKVEERRKTIIYENDDGQVSMTEAVPANIMTTETKTRCKTGLCQNEVGDISMMLTVPVNIDVKDSEPERRKTIVYYNAEDQLDMTKALPENIENYAENISVTQSVPGNLMLSNKLNTNKRNTIAYNKTEANLDMTEALHSNVLVVNNNGKRKTILFENDAGNISVTQSVPGNLMLPNEPHTDKRKSVYNETKADLENSNVLVVNNDVKRKTILFENDEGNISVTQSVPGNLMLPNNLNTMKRNTIAYNETEANLDVTEALYSNDLIVNKDGKRKTILFENDEGNISVTQSVPGNLMLPNRPITNKGNTIAYNETEANLDMTEALPCNVLVVNNNGKRKTILFENDAGNISVTQSVPGNLMLPNEPHTDKRKSVYNETKADLENSNVLVVNNDGKRKTVLFENYAGNISVTQSVPTDLMLLNMPITDKRKTVYDETKADLDMTETLPGNALLTNNYGKRNTKLFENDAGNKSMTQSVADNLMLLNKPDSDKQKTIGYENDARDISVTRSRSNNVFLQKIQGKLEEGLGNVSSTQAVPANIMVSMPSVSDQKNITICEDATEDISNIRTVSSIDHDMHKIKDKKGSISATETALKYVEPDTKSNKIGQSVVCEDYNISITHLGPVKINVTGKSIIFDPGNNLTAISITEPKPLTHNDDNFCNFSMTKPIPAQIVSIQSVLDDKASNDRMDKLIKENYGEKFNKSVTEHRGVLVYEAAIELDKDQKMDTEGKTFSVNNGRELLSHSSLDKANAKSASQASVKSGNTDATISQVVFNSSVLAIVNDEQIMKTEPMQEGEYAKSEAESMIEVRSGTSDRDLEIQENRTGFKASILDKLLDMTNADDADADGEDEDKNFMVNSNSDVSSNNIVKSVSQKWSKESYLLIKDSDDEQGNKMQSAAVDSRLEIPNLKAAEPLPIEDPDKRPPEVVSQLQRKLGALQNLLNNRSPPKHRQLAVLSSDLENVGEQEEINKTTKADKTLNNADDTNALLDMLTRYTDDRGSRDNTFEDMTRVEPLKFNGHIAIEHKIEANETRRNIVPDRKSIIRSREDLLKDISMAQAMMKYDGEHIDESVEAGESLDEISPSGSPMRNEVVKKLEFDDEDSIQDISQVVSHQEMIPTPLKKTAFGETTYMQDPDYNGKVKVIPSYLKDVSNDLKQLMNDLVKPMADVIPLENKPKISAQKTASTMSMQIQANLLTSSQIDLDLDMSSGGPSCSAVHHDISAIGNKPKTRALQSKVIVTESPSVYESEIEYSSTREQVESGLRLITSPGRVIVFDHNNPLNNVLLPPIDRVEVHKYNPAVSKESMMGSVHSNSTKVGHSQFDVESRLALYNLAMPSGDASPVKIGHVHSCVSADSKPASIDEAVTVKCDLKDTEVNTVIAMKANSELLDASSSLTLVDDAINDSNFDVESPSNSPVQRKSRSPVRVVFKVQEHDSSIKLDSDLTSNDDDFAEEKLKAKKRLYSPSRRDKIHGTFATEEVTPKPATKMQKVSSVVGKSHPKKVSCDVEPQLPITVTMEEPKSNETSSQDGARQSPDKKFERMRHKKPGTAVTINQLMAEYDANIDQKTLTTQIVAAISAKSAISGSTMLPVSGSSTEVECHSPDCVSAFTSTLNFNSDSEGGNLRSECQSRPDWRPELLHEMSSKNLITECESSVNVVAKIDVLPFMGTSDCEWESRGADAWSFRLLRARLRLLVRLEHRHENASRTSVRADTPLRCLLVAQARRDNKVESPIASLCVQFAAETMRHFALSCSRAGDVPALLRRCAGAARVASRWGRAMHAARAHLAYSLTGDGALSLKVANIPLRSVWEVTMRVELAAAEGGAGGAGGAPWPRAADVRVASVVSEQPVGAAELCRVLAPLPSDWGHAPRAIWKIFKHLKHKTFDDDLVLGM